MPHITRVLAVDEPQTTRLLRTVLMSQGYDVRAAADRTSALSCLATWHPDLVLADVCAPHLGGFVFCRRMRAVSRAPIIVLSVAASEEAKADALDSGADDYMIKPFGIIELLARVRAVLRRARVYGDGVLPLDAGVVHAAGTAHRLRARRC